MSEKPNEQLGDPLLGCCSHFQLLFSRIFQSLERGALPNGHVLALVLREPFLATERKFQMPAL